MGRLNYGIPSTYGSFDLQEFHEFVISYARSFNYPVRSITICPRIYEYLVHAINATNWVAEGKPILFRDFDLNHDWITILKGDKLFYFND